ncbi:MAG: hypothetical protein ACOC2Q_00985 [Spirochaetota bacterium]
MPNSGQTEDEGFTVVEPDGDQAVVGTKFVFRTTDADLAGTFNWHLLDHGLGSGETYSVTVSKASGYGYAEMGVLANAESASDFLFFVIDINSSFAIGRKSGEVYTYVSEWQASSSIRAGYDAQNTLTIEFLADQTRFLINDELVYSNLDTSLSSGSRGLVAAVGPEEYESFSGDGVEVRYVVE